ncbi:MAG: Mth938-like domain-containing protein [Methylophilaceae bacterium]
MKLHLTQAENNNLITGYGVGYIEINKQRYEQQIIVMAEKLILDWSAKNFESLTEAHFTQLLSLKPEVVLLGTGSTHRFVHPKLTASLAEKNIAVECMRTDAACRTYNILMSEGRNVAAALLL